MFPCCLWLLLLGGKASASWALHLDMEKEWQVFSYKLHG